MKSEIAEILKDCHGINRDKFNSALQVITCDVVDNNVLVHPQDLKLAITCGIENRDARYWEWD